jgi:DNA end-binding protein Ku
MAARAIWTGALTFGLVNVPVRLVTAVSQKEVRFHMLHDADGGRIQLKRFCSVDGQEVPYEHIVKGYELAKHRYVTISREELEALDAKATRTVEIHDFVDLAEIDPIYYDHTYYLVPDASAAKAYRLLHDAMKRAGKVAIARAVLRTKEYLCCVRPVDGALALSTMNHADEIVPVSSLEIPEGGAPSERELHMAEQLVDSLAARFEPERFPDVHREKVLALVERKAEGKTIEAPAAEEPAAPVVSLADALSASLAAARDRGGRADGATEGAHRHRLAEAAHTVSRRGAARPRARGKKRA